MAAYAWKDGGFVYLISEGRLVNLASGQGHPVEVMDTSFAVQALSIEHMAKNHKDMAPGVYEFPPELDVEIAKVRRGKTAPELSRRASRARTTRPA